MTILAGAAVGWWRARAGLGWSRALGARLTRLQTIGLVAALALAAVVATTAIRAGMVVPDALLQTWDPLHHVSGVQAVRDLGNASSFGGLDSVAGSAATGLCYYPTVWHALVALAPGSVPVVANASTIVIAALVPGVAAIVVLATRSWADTRLSGMLLCPPFLAGVVVTHGSGAFVLLLLLLGPLLVVRAGSLARAQWRRGRAPRVAGALLAVAALLAVVAWVLLRFAPFVDTMNYSRAASGTVAGGMCDGRWLVVGWLAAVVLVGLMTGPENDFRCLTGVWTKSAPCLAALVPITASLLGALGAVSLGLLAVRAWERVLRGAARDSSRTAPTPGRSMVVAAVLPAVLLLAVGVRPTARSSCWRISGTSTPTPVSATLCAT